MIEFHVESGGTELNLQQQKQLTVWITDVIRHREGVPGAINYILCGDDYLHRMNVEYLQHDTLTDIITFPYDAFPTVSGDLFISTERVTENAGELNSSYTEELHRVIVHGVLHLCGQGDKTENEAKRMRDLEDWALGIRPEALRRVW